MPKKSPITTETAYYHLPPVWIGADPFRGCKAPSVSIRQKEVFKKTLASGIKVVVFKDGLFVFDFSSWLPNELVPELAMKGISSISSPQDQTTKKLIESTKRLMKFAQRETVNVYKRIEVMNGHLACLNSALKTCQKQSWPICQVINAGEYLKVDKNRDGIYKFHLLPNHSPTHASIEKFRSTTDTPTELHTRQVVTLRTVKESFKLLDSIMKSPVPDSLKLVTMLLQSAKAYREHDPSGSLILSWTVLEKLISFIWAKMLKDNREREEGGVIFNFINSKRKEKLNGNDYSASTRIEILSLLNLINMDLYTKLNEIRQVRNAWLHNLSQANSQDASHALVAGQNLFSDLAMVKIALNISHQTTL